MRVAVAFALLATCAIGQRRGGAPPPATGPWANSALTPDQRADLLLRAMTLEEKLQLVHGLARGDPAAARSNGGAGFVPGIPRLGIPDLQMADAAVGVTRGAARGRYSTLLPSTLALASSWDLKAAYDYGALIGRELRDQGYNMSLGGGVDLAREPRNGRNFEYMGEDPELAGWMDGEAVRGLQAQGVMGDVKHYAFNDQENGRSVLNVVLPDRRAMRESDLLAFEIAIKDAHPAAVMCAYNQVNGAYSCENPYLLNRVLKNDIGFQGFVISDWGATHSTVKAALAGLDLEMPGNTYFGAPLAQAIAEGSVPMARLDDMVHRILRSEFAAGLFDRRRTDQVPDIFAGLATARQIAGESIVVLRDSNTVLPLDAGRIKSIAIIGGHADVGVLSGGGSAQVNPPGGNAVADPSAPPAGGRGRGGPSYFPSSPMKAIAAAAPAAAVRYSDGVDLAAAAALARSAAVAIVFCTQPMSEGRDAPSLALPDNQDELVEAVAAANPRTIVVLETGGAVAMRWFGQVAGVLEAWYPGISGGEAIADVLFGRVNPSAKTAVSFPASDADLPHPVEFHGALTPGSGRGAARSFDVPYDAGLEVGYKWYDAKGITPAVPFGFGISYTHFAYGSLKATLDAGGIEIRFTLKNTGRRAGSEIAEVYAALPDAAGEPPRRLIGWQRVELAAGEAREVRMAVPMPRLQIFGDAGASAPGGGDAWRTVPGVYRIEVGSSSRDLPLHAELAIGSVH